MASQNSRKNVLGLPMVLCDLVMQKKRILDSNYLYLLETLEMDQRHICEATPSSLALLDLKLDRMTHPWELSTYRPSKASTLNWSANPLSLASNTLASICGFGASTGLGHLPLFSLVPAPIGINEALDGKRKWHEECSVLWQLHIHVL